MVAGLVILGAFTGLIEGTFIKLYNSKNPHGGFLFTAFICLFSMLYFLVTDKGGFVFTGEVFIYGIFGAIMYGGASYLTYVALKEGSFALTMLILAYAQIFSICYGLFYLGEQLSLSMKIGIALMLISIPMVRADSKDKGNVKITLKWAVCTGLSVFGAGMYGVIQRMQQIRFEDRYTNEFMVFAIGLSAVMLLIIGLVKDGKHIKQVIKKGTLFFAGAGVANGMTNMISLVLNTMVAISVITPIRSGAKTLLSFLVSVLIFKERFTTKQIIGVVISGISLILLSM